ncbi:unnamed protein product, partial [Mesorhabditis spiculigera]
MSKEKDESGAAPKILKHDVYDIREDGHEPGKLTIVERQDGKIYEYATERARSSVEFLDHKLYIAMGAKDQLASSVGDS